MKKIGKNLLIVFLTLISISSCNDDWLQPQPLSIFSPESIFIDKEGIEGILLVCRKNLRWEFCTDFNIALTCENISSDTYVVGTSGERNMKDWFTQVTPTDDTNLPSKGFKNHWNNHYNNIRNANTVISRIDFPTWNSESEKNEILAEAYFHRAYAYYRLVNQFGDVPFLGKEYTSPKVNFYTHSRKVILTQIQSDLEYAVRWLPDVVLPGKINKAAGNHLLTKVYLQNSEFDKAIVSSSAVIDDGIHSLMTTRFGIDKSDNRLNVIWDLHQKENKSLTENTEAILVVQDRWAMPGVSTTVRNGGNWSMTIYVPSFGLIKDSKNKASVRNIAGDKQTLAIGIGWGQNRPTNYSAYEIWENSGSDLRCDPDTNWMTMAKVYYNDPTSVDYGKPVTKAHMNQIDTIRSWYPWPHYKVYTEDEVRPTLPQGGHSDWYIFRLAETYLLRAEAYYYKGQFSQAAADINKVRERALAPPITSGDVTLEYIIDERARELTAEEPRYTELTRISSILADNNLFGYSNENFYTKNFWFDVVTKHNNFYNKGIFYPNEYRIGAIHIFWPVPQEAIDSNTGGRINQNIAYVGVDLNIPPKIDIHAND